MVVKTQRFLRGLESVDLHALFDVVPDAMVIIDASGTIQSFSRGAETMFGYNEAEVTGRNVNMLMPSPDREQHDEYIAHYVDTGVARIIGTGRITTALRRDGSTFPIRLEVGELEWSGEAGFVGFIRDLSQERRAERELHTLQAELAHVSRISSMGSLATSLAHELNQPLTAVANYANSARDLLQDPDEEHLALAREAMDECAKQSVRAGKVVHRLREFISRGETERHLASLRTIVKEGSALALMNGDSAGVTFETAIEPCCDRVLVDPVQIQQVVLNLLRNALEAMLDSDNKQLQVSCERHDGEHVRVTVADSGPGIEPKVAERLFHPFNSSKPGGLGLGLSISHSIVTAHGGKIWVEPSKLGGTAFHFTLPLAEVGADHG